MARFEPGDHVKAEFRDERGGESEWMWVWVESADDALGVIFGWLDNEPVVHAGARLGQQIAVSYDNVREHVKGSAFQE